MADQVPRQVRKDRNARYRQAFERAALSYRERFVGQQVSVLWESTTQVDDNGWRMEGLTGNYLRVTAQARRPLWNELSRVLLQAVDAAGLGGTVCG